jgi:hypothetical protein
MESKLNVLDSSGELASVASSRRADSSAEFELQPTSVLLLLTVVGAFEFFPGFYAADAWATQGI